ncbi:hypothetical protein EVAR_70042_1 [Eumeta japonica]|uniref:Uncharacterized protein n=1 Tax=Eumeta variegata TaxID=151549 RepID=A0A4C2A9D0_EUMVA|nr:hypothetical protein EVAR_70042_1 [Eumeta japonica]
MVGLDQTKPAKNSFGEHRWLGVLGETFDCQPGRGFDPEHVHNYDLDLFLTTWTNYVINALPMSVFKGSLPPQRVGPAQRQLVPSWTVIAHLYCVHTPKARGRTTQNLLAITRYTLTNLQE